MFIFFSRGQRRLSSDWAGAQADISLCWAHMSFCWFCHAMVQFIENVKLAWDSQLGIRFGEFLGLGLGLG